MNKKLQSKKQYQIFLVYDAHTRGVEIYSGQENDSYPEYEDEYTDFTPEYLTLEAPSWSETIKINFDPKEEKKLYLIIVRYTTGSTFGTSYGHWYIEGAYKTELETIKVKDVIINNKYIGYKPWEGYFERLENIEVVLLPIIAKAPIKK